MVQESQAAREWDQFQRVYERVLTVATRILQEEGHINPTILFVRLRDERIRRLGIVNLLNGDMAHRKHLDIMENVVGLAHVEVAVYVREVKERRGNTAGDQEIDVVMFHFMGKHYELTVSCERTEERPRVVPRALDRVLLVARRKHGLQH